jgi:hypothetical protein
MPFMISISTGVSQLPIDWTHSLLDASHFSCNASCSIDDLVERTNLRLINSSTNGRLKDHNELSTKYTS